MVVMAMEGTKLGGDHFSAEEALDIGKNASNSDDFKGTKLGELSDFEKSLSLDQQAKASVSIPVPTQQEEKRKASFGQQPAGTEGSPAVPHVMDEFVHSVKDYQVEDIINGIVTRVEKGLVFVDIAYKSEGIIEAEELASTPNVKATDIVKPGDHIKVMIMKLENKEGHPVLSKRRADYESYWSNLFHCYKKKEALTVYIMSAVKGGLVADYGGIRGFIPASHVSKEYQDNMEALVKQSINVKPIEVDRKRRKVVLSQKMAAQQNDSIKAKELLKQIEPGQVRTGTVTNLKSFGAFVDLGGVEGLIHISEMSWGRINDPAEVLQTGQKIDVFVLGVDDESGRISLGLKQLQPDPWVNVEQRYHIGDTVHGTVTRAVKFGAFVELEKGIEGLIHISELAEQQPANAEDIVKPGQGVEAKIIKMFPAEQRIGLSLRAHPEIDAKQNFEQYQETKAVETDTAPTIGDIVKEAQAETK
jgi:small subunit ribosomal protein S1